MSRIDPPVADVLPQQSLGRAIASGLVAGGLHALALALPQGWPLAWVALVPLLHTAERARGGHVVAAAIAYAVVFFASDVTPWLLPAFTSYFQLERGPARAFAAMTVALGSLVYGGMLGLALALRGRSGRPLGIVWCAALWCVWEPIRALIPPSFPASVLPISQVGALPVLQIASVTGIAGVTALIVAVNAAIAQLSSVRAAPARRRATFAATAAVAAGVVLWGSARVARAPGSDGESQVLVVDGAARSAAESTLERYIAATKIPPGPLPALVVWPESAVTVDLASDGTAWKRLSSFVADLGVTLVTGGVGSAVADDDTVVRFNSVHVVRPRHGMMSYHKRLVVPFAESWPAVLGAPPPSIDPIAAGHGLVLFDEGATRFGSLICFEITDAASARGLAELGARFLVSVNNDVWFGSARAPHDVWARVRAVESGLPIVRASNGGVSAVIDPFGRIVASNRAAGEPSVLWSTIPERVDTVYVRTGDVFLWACAAVVLVGLVPRRNRVTESARRES